MAQELVVTRRYEIPLDLMKQYQDKLAEAAKWLEDEIIKRNISPSLTLRHVRTDR
jgi:hypothetical protein